MPFLLCWHNLPGLWAIAPRVSVGGDRVLFPNRTQTGGDRRKS
ncbi:hypothetical protein [Oxynema sp. CENA135]|nr:hypothetical protein [Oxynema sp. CENA135]